MRLSRTQQHTIEKLVQTHIGANARVMLFGSRLDNDKRGGDVDLFIETPKRVPLLQRAELKLALEKSLQLPVDLIFQQTGMPATAFQHLAKAQARPLEPPRP